jgi:23S rRNA (guanosine2251-2'-O)-methyltransferase
MILYGRNAVREALCGRRASSVGDVWATHGATREPWLQGIRVRTSTPAEIERRCGSSAHQGVCAAAGGYPYVSAAELLAAGLEPLIVALDEVQDPQNLGSICRTAECAGASGVAIPERRAAEVTPAACKASAGALEHLKVARVRNMADFLEQARAAGCWCYGASAEPAAGDDRDDRARDGRSDRGDRAGAGDDRGDRAGDGRSDRAGVGGRGAIPYDAPDYRGAGVVLVLGSEGRGLRPRVAGSCDQLIALPVRGRVGSLGVSAAAAAILYEILQNRARVP